MSGFDEMSALLDELTAVLRDLTETQHGVKAAVRSDDLAELGECMKREQALSLSIRSIDQRRIALQKQLKVEDVPLSDLPSRAPDADTREKIRIAARSLADQYQIMQGAVEVARSALECSLHNVEKHLVDLGVNPKLSEELGNAAGTIHADIRA